MTASAMLAEARKSLGLSGRPNYITNWYANQVNDTGFRSAPWCDMAVSYWAAKSGNLAAMGGLYAYTVWHAQHFERAGRWTYGISGIRPGDIIFFDWQGSGRISGIDHVGVVEKVLDGGRVQVIEGNTNNTCARRTRSGATIVGYGRPAYGGSLGGGSSSGSTGTSYGTWRNVAAGSRTIRRGHVGSDVQVAQRAVKSDPDGYFGPDTESKVRDYQERHRLDVDGIVGPQTWGTILGGSSSEGSSPASGLVVDGQLGPATGRATQRALGVDDDGIWGPVTVRAMQLRCGLTGSAVDGRLGPQTTRAVQRRVGAVVDGIWPSIASVNSAGIVTFNTAAQSETTSKLQAALNAGRF